MFLQQKEYTQLFRGAEKLMTAGLCKQIIWDQKIKIDYYMEHLPVPEGTNGQIRLFYLVRTDHKDGLLKREAACPLQFSKSKNHYTMTQREQAGNRIIKIDNCVIELDGDYTVRLFGKPYAIGYAESKPRVTSEDASGDEPRVMSEDVTESKQGETSKEIVGYKTENIQDDAQRSKLGMTSENAQGREPRVTQVDVQRSEAGVTSKNASKSEPRETDIETGSETDTEPSARQGVRRIDDLKMLLGMGQQCACLYYNSFLLHSFYQYRHVLLGDGFVGVPDYFYEREAIAAKMMGFSYFVEAKDIDNVSFEEGTPAGMPKDGSYGYFLCRLQSQ